MKEFLTQSAYFGMVLTLAAFFFGKYLKNKLKSELCNPILVATMLIIAVLLVTGVSYEDYNSGAKYISYLLTPATVALAIPLYEQFEILKKNWKAVLLGILSGVIASVGSITLLAVIYGLGRTEWITLLPKSVTTAIGMGVSEELGGNPSITAAVIILTGVAGNVMAHTVMKLFKIKEPVAVGVAIGTSSHAIGTSKACEIGETEGAMSGLSIAVAGILTVIAVSFICG